MTISKEAIAWAWELLTEVYKISKDDLYVTIFEGDASENLERDQDAYNFWKEHIDESRIINGNKKITSGKWVIPDHVDHVLKFT